jgi:hypothetical protein
VIPNDNTDTLYADFTVRSHLLPAKRPWRYRPGDLVRVGGEVVQITDGFLHVVRALGRSPQGSAPAGTTVLIIRSVGTGASF